MCPNCRAFITTDDRVCPYCQARVGPRAIDLRQSGEILGGLIPQAHFTTVIILVINFALYAAEALNPDVAKAGESLPWLYMHNEMYRLVTAGFLHGGILHILMNSWALFVVGGEVEQFYGTSRMIVFYIVTTVTGFLASSMLGHTASLGSSAGIFGLMGAMLALGFTDKTSVGQAIKGFYTQWLIFGVIMSLSAGVDIWAHAGGFAGGFALGMILLTPRARLMWKEPLIRGAAGVCIAVTLLCFLRMVMALMSHSA
jgi:rhomboid protease GluP